MKLFNILMLCLWASTLPAQSLVCFSYDDAGNRVLRKTCLPQISASDGVDVGTPMASQELLPVRERENSVAEPFDFLLYPNPTSGIFQIELQGAEKAMLRIFDQNARMLLERTVGNSQIDISDQPVGIYVLWIKPEEGPAKSQIIVLESP